MALPMDFWRNEHSLNIFRTKPCQRLMKDGVCEWRSQCQFSHCAGWPRRPPLRHKYSPEICPNIQKIGDAFGGVQIKNCCTQGFKCQWAHSKEEIMFHPQIFKTLLCEEFENGDKKRNTKRGKKCHRYYCPFAHGQQELRTSELTLEQRQAILAGLDYFPSDKCCNVCACPCTVPSVMPTQMRTPAPAVEALDMPPFPQGSSSPWQFSPTSSRSLLQQTVRDQEQLQQLRQSVPMPLPSSAFGHDPFPRGNPKAKAVGKVNNVQNGTDDKWKSLGSPAFVKISEDGFAAVGPWESNKQAPAPGPFDLDLPVPKWMTDDVLTNGTLSSNGYTNSESFESQEPVKPTRLEEAILKQLVYTML